MTKNSNPKSNIQRHGSVAKSLFLGNILEENLFPYPAITSDEAETLSMIIESVDRFMGEKAEEYRSYDVNGEFPDEYIEKLKELGLFGLIIPEDHGGIGLSPSGYARVVQQTSRYDASTSITIGAHSSIGMKGLLLYGNDEQKKKYLSVLASGEMIAAFCLTEPGSGSDAASIKATALKNSDGTWTLNGEKLWISNGSIADFFTVFARTESGDKGKLSAFIVERSWDGVSHGPKEDKMGIRASSTTSVLFDNVTIPADCLLGEEGKGFKIAMNILNNGRTGLGGGCVGGLKECIKLACSYASERKQFGKKIGEYLLIKEKIAQMTVDCFAAESVINMIGHYIDAGVEDFSVEAAISKVYITEATWRAVNETLQVAGGNGYMREFPYERMVRDSRINLIFEGTNEILRLFIALSGMKDAGRALKNMGKAAGNIFNDPIKGFGLMSQYASNKITQLTSLGRERLELHESLREDAVIYELGTLGLARAGESMLRRYERGIIEEQLILKRLADSVTDLFVGLCVLSRVNTMIEEKGEKKCESERKIARIFSQQAKRRLKSNLGGIEKSEDSSVGELADEILENGGYRWDVI